MNFNEPNFIDKANGILTVRDYPDFTDVSQTGKFKLPSKTYLIAIPPYSKPNIQLSDKKEENIKGVLPSLNPKVKLLNDTTLIFEQVQFSDAVVENIAQNDLEIIGYVWYREYRVISC